MLIDLPLSGGPQVVPTDPVVFGDTKMTIPKRAILTKARVAAFEIPQQGRPVVYDTRVPGFGLRITLKGVRSFIVRRKVSGRVLTITLGRFPALGVEQARKIAIELNGDIARGENPQEAKRKARQEQILEVLWENYFEQHLKPNCRTWKAAERIYERHLKLIAGRRISTISRQEVRSLHNRVAQKNGRYAANRLLQLFRAMYNWGAPDLDNPGRGIKLFHETKRERFLHPDELPRFFEALADEWDHSVRDLVLLCLLTGARRSNVLAMRWDEIELDRGTWTIPGDKAKNLDPVTLSLHQEAVSLLKFRQNGFQSDWVFPGRGRSGHMVEPKKGWQRIRERAGMPDLLLHNLRRTLGSWQAAQGASLTIIGKSLGHRHPASTAIYARLNLDPVRESVNSAIDAMFSAAKQNSENPNKVHYH